MQPSMQPDNSTWSVAFLAESGHVAAQYQLGVRFLLGEKVEQDLEAAYQWLCLAATGDHPEARNLAALLAPFRPVKQRRERKPSFMQHVRKAIAGVVQRWSHLFQMISVLDKRR